MKYYFIKKQSLSRLVLFFAGWGMDERPFSDCVPQDSDLLVCYDYRSLIFDFSLLRGYSEIRLVAWSMGVWAASRIFFGTAFPIRESIAVNGTLTPVDEACGIPQSIFEGTLKGLNERTLQKFRRRMCGSAEALDAFMQRAPQRSVDELREELQCIGEQARFFSLFPFVWDKVVIGANDLVFTATNQHNAWKKEKNTEIVVKDIPHYSLETLKNVLCEDMKKVEQ